MAEKTDIDLLKRCLTGDQQAYERIVEKYQGLVCSITYSGCGDLAQSEDLAQETFITAWKKLADLRELEKFKSWICTIARNLTQRSRRNKEEAISLDTAPECASPHPQPGDQAITNEEEILVWESLERIPENYREPMVLFYREDQSIAHVAEAMEISEDAVKQRLSRGRKLVQTQLAKLVETTLVRSRPTKVFTASVLTALSIVKPKAVSAATMTAVTKGSAGLGLGQLGFLIKIPLIAWAVKLSIQNARSERERELTIRHLLIGFGHVLLYVVALCTIPLWGHYIKHDLIRATLPGLLMFVFLMPHILSSYRLRHRIKQIRMGDGTHEEPRSIEGTGPSPIYVRLGGSLILVLSWALIVPILIGDVLALALLALLTITGWGIGTRLCLRFPKRHFQIYGATLALAALIAIAIKGWRNERWMENIAVDSNTANWLFWSNQGMLTTVFVLTLLVWKRTYYQKPKR